MSHKHEWNLIRTFIGEGEPRLMKQMVVSTILDTEDNAPPKMRMWTDSSQEYALYHCVCGEKKGVKL